MGLGGKGLGNKSEKVNLPQNEQNALSRFKAKPDKGFLRKKSLFHGKSFAKKTLYFMKNYFSVWNGVAGRPSFE